MSTLLPPAFLFRFALPVKRIAKLPKSGTRPLNLPADTALPSLAELGDGNRYGELRIAWNGDGLGISLSVRGKRFPPEADAAVPENSDGLSLWIDTRNLQDVHRASRFCQRFLLCPTGGGKRGAEPVIRRLPIARAREEAPPVNTAEIRLWSEVDKQGYTLEAWLPASVLHGYDPAATPRLGFYYAIHDSELGDQFLSVGTEFPHAHDPSLWCTLELQR